MRVAVIQQQNTADLDANLARSMDKIREAVRIANNSSYGLSGAVNSASLERAMSVAKRIRTGTLGVNGGLWFGPDSPFGGYKQSGVGREHGREGFEEYLNTKTIGMPG